MTITHQAGILLCLVALSLGCSSGYKQYECVVSPDEIAPDPQAIWDCHRLIMKRAARGKKFTLREFREAAAFFEGLTAIDPGAVLSEYGPIPPDDLKQKLTAWDRWYEEHGSALIWDAEHRAVRVSGRKAAG
jgi:hypothetical protein